MTAFKETFTGSDDRARVLMEILRRGSGVPGMTLIALVDRATQDVLTVRRMPTPEPVLDAESYFDDELIHRLSVALRAVARDTAPERTVTRDRLGELTCELVTVVCRDGEAAITPLEAQFFWAWRRSNHFTSALDGDVYVVTPQGWANLLPEYSGEVPALPPLPAPTTMPAPPELPAGPDRQILAREVQDAERLLADASLALLGPEPGECLLCYVHRMLVEFGCDCRLRFAAHYRDVRAPRATGLERRLGNTGGFCDCEIFLNGYDLRSEYWVPDIALRQGALDQYELYQDQLAEEEQGEEELGEEELGEEELGEEEQTWPMPLPPCAGVRAGSTQPCSLWGRRWRGGW